MKEIDKTIDINAKIYNLEATIKVVDNTPEASISFLNLGDDNITAVKLEATAYNTFNEVVFINNKEKFYLLIQDINAKKNKTIKNIKVNLPHNDIRRLELKASQICYENGTIVQCEEEQNINITLQEYDNNTDRETLNALKHKFNRHYKNIPLEVDEGWICGCGVFNTHDQHTCHFCNTDKTEMLASSNEEYIENAKQAYKDKIEFKKEKEMINSFVKDEKNKKFIKPLILAAIALFVVIGAFFTLMPKYAYSSEDAMKKALKGTYTYYTSTNVASRQAIISDTKVKLTYKYITSTVDLTIKEWDYKNGIIQTNTKTITVNKDGSLNVGEDLFKKGGYMSQSTTGSGGSTYESGLTALKVQNVTLTSNSSYKVCTGSVKNTGKKTYKFVKVKGAFKDSSGKVVDTDWTYAVGSEGLAPGETKTFRMSVPKDYKITKCTVTIFDYN